MTETDVETARCPECGMPLTMHHDPGCSQPCGRCAARLSTGWDAERGFVCCGGYLEHSYRCTNRVWPATATPEIQRQAVRGDCIAPAHAQIEDTVVAGLDYQQRKRLTEILAQVWDDGFEYGQRGSGT